MATTAVRTLLLDTPVATRHAAAFAAFRRLWSLVRLVRIAMAEGNAAHRQYRKLIAAGVPKQDAARGALQPFH